MSERRAVVRVSQRAEGRIVELFLSDSALADLTGQEGEHRFAWGEDDVEWDEETAASGTQEFVARVVIQRLYEDA